MRREFNAFMVAGVTSGVGKTTITMGLVSALRRRGLQVQPFKTGPDYIDPTYLAKAAGVPCRNLDTWMLPHSHVAELFNRAVGGKDAAVVEGVMGLYDGRSATTDEGSGAELSKLLGLNVILVADASSVARSIAATVLGFQQFDPNVRIAGVILNRVAGPRHAAICTDAIQAATGLPVLGALSRDQRLELPERHLGLVPAVEGATADSVFSRIADAVERAVDLGKLLSATRSERPARQGQSLLFPDKPVASRARIAVAMDRAFSFYYQDSLDLLEAWGAELAPFSVLGDGDLPSGSTGVYIGGGFPEVFAQDIAANTGIAAALHRAAKAGIPVYGECGGLMYLGRTLTDFDGKTYQMAGLLPLGSRLTGSRLTLGYRTVRARADGPCLCKGDQARGHEFHWSTIDEEAPSQTPKPEAAYEVLDQGGRHEGYQQGTVLGSYVHLHLAAGRRLAPRFVAYCSGPKEN